MWEWGLGTYGSVRHDWHYRTCSCRRCGNGPHRWPATAPAAGNFDLRICERADVESGLKSALEINPLSGHEQSAWDSRIPTAPHPLQVSEVLAAGPR